MLILQCMSSSRCRLCLCEEPQAQVLSPTEQPRQERPCLAYLSMQSLAGTGTRMHWACRMHGYRAAAIGLELRLPQRGACRADSPLVRSLLALWCLPLGCL